MTRATIGRAAGKALIGLVAVLFVLAACAGCAKPMTFDQVRAGVKHCTDRGLRPVLGDQFRTGDDTKAITRVICVDRDGHEFPSTPGGAQ